LAGSHLLGLTTTPTYWALGRLNKKC